jgi:hypothetical protein
MARPKKKTVDYFPHACNHGQTIFILEQVYKELGYSFWFKLLEMLGSTDNHVLDYNNPRTQRFLQAKTFTEPLICEKLLNLLAELEAIDQELWQNRIIWCQKFVDGISDVYKNRRVEIPIKPNNYEQKQPQLDISTPKLQTETHKVKYSKVKESKVNNITPLKIKKLDELQEKKGEILNKMTL